MKNWKKYTFEFLTIFIGVFAAFALDNWKDNRRDQIVENKILKEIHSGLEKDLVDIDINEKGHKQGIRAVYFFKDILNNKQLKQDSLAFHYFNLLRDFVSLQNVSGYETLKSKGLEIIENDSLRSKIISLYEYDYSTLKKLEEDYAELQFYENYSKKIDLYLASNFEFDKEGRITGLKKILNISDKNKKALLIDLWRILNNRLFVLGYYSEVKQKIHKLQEAIKEELEK